MYAFLRNTNTITYLLRYCLIQNKKFGFGVYYFDSGDVYEGSWLNDTQSGHGKYSYQNGDFFEGKFSTFIQNDNNN